MRLKWLWIPLAGLFTLWVLNGGACSEERDEVTDMLNMTEPSNLTRLAVLGMVLITVVAVVRMLTKKGEE